MARLDEPVKLAIAGLRVLAPARHGDDRGFFSETWSRAAFAAVGITCDFVQDNHSLSRLKGTLRGLHFQPPPHAQAKLVRVVRGAVLDVAVDLRRGSPTFGRHAGGGTERRRRQAASSCRRALPTGSYALSRTTEVLYKVSAAYAPEHDAVLLWDDEALAIAWPVSAAEAILSARDRLHPRLADLGDIFTFAGDAAS